MLQDGASLHMPSVVYVMRETVCPDEPGGFDAVRQCEQPEALREASQCSDGCETMLGIIIAFRSGVITKKNTNNVAKKFRGTPSHTVPVDKYKIDTAIYIYIYIYTYI